MAKVRIWSEQFAMDIALGFYPIEEVLEDYNISVEVWAQLEKDEGFKAAVKEYAIKLKERGVTFELKARMAAEQHIHTLHSIANDPKEPGQTRMQAISKLAEWAGIDKGAPVQSATGLGNSLVINMPGEGMTKGSEVAFEIPNLKDVSRVHPATDN